MIPATTDAAALFWSARTRIFDLDGTRVHTLPDLTRCLNQALQEEGLPVIDADVMRRSLQAGLEGSVDAAMAAMDGDGPREREAVPARDCRRYDAEPARPDRPYPGARELMARLHRRGQPVAVFTNKTQAMTRRVLERLDLADGIVAVVGADTCGTRKPDPAPLRLALRLLGADEGDALLVRDSVADRP